MAIENQQNRVSYFGNGSTTTPYEVPFRFDDDAWMIVRKIVGGLTSELVNGVDYEFGGNSLTEDGFITTTLPVPNTATIVIERFTPAEQILTLVPNAPLPAKDLEKALDQSAMALIDRGQRLDFLELNSIRGAFGEALPPLPYAADRVGKILGFDNTGAPLLVSGPLLTDIAAIEGAVATSETWALAASQAGYNAQLSAESAAFSASRFGLKTIYLSAAGIISDTDLSLDGTTTGIDQSAAVQAILDGGNKEVVWDVKCTVKDLLVDSNTIIRRLPGCGAKLADNANRAILSNRNYKSRAGGPPEDAIFDEGIQLLGSDGILQLNQQNQEHHTEEEAWIVGVRFFNVNNLTIEGVVFRPRTFAYHVSNCTNVRWKGIRVNVGVTDGYNYDGPHLNGPLSQVLFEDGIINSMDDNIGLNADDGLFQSDGAETWYRLGFGSNGPVRGVTYRRMFLDDSGYGFRLLTSSSEMDDILIQDTYGTFRHHGVLIDNYSENPHLMIDPGPGNFKRIRVDGWTARSKGSAAYHGAIYPMSGKGENYEFSRILRHDLVSQRDTPTWKLFKAYFAPGHPALPYAFCDVENIDIDGYEYKTLAGENTLYRHFATSQGKAKRLRFANVKIDSIPTNEIEGTLVSHHYDSVLDEIIIEETVDVGDNLAFLVVVTGGSTLGKVTIRNFQRPMFIGGQTAATSSIVPLAGNPKDFILRNNGPLFVGYGDAIYRMLYVLPQNVSLSGDFTFDTFLNNAILVLRIRDNSTSIITGGRGGYSMEILGASITIRKDGTSLGTVAPAGGLVAGDPYHFEWRAVGTALKAYVRRENGEWLSAAGAWQTLKVACLTATDGDKTGQGMSIIASRDPNGSVLRPLNIKCENVVVKNL